MHRPSAYEQIHVALVTEDGEAAPLILDALSKSRVRASRLSKDQLVDRNHGFGAVILDCSENLFPLREDDIRGMPIARVALVINPTQPKLKWLRSMEFHGVIQKPVQPVSIASTLFCALGVHEHSQSLIAACEEMDFKLNCRKFVVLTQLGLMRDFDLGESEAYASMRSVAMDAQISVEEFCIQFLSAPERWLGCLRRFVHHQRCCHKAQGHGQPVAI